MERCLAVPYEGDTVGDKVRTKIPANIIIVGKIMFHISVSYPVFHWVDLKYNIDSAIQKKSFCVIPKSFCVIQSKCYTQPCEYLVEW